MTQEEKEKKMLPLILTLAERTNNKAISWERDEDGYHTAFGEDTIEFSYEMDPCDEENLIPVNYALVFSNPNGIKYEIYYTFGGATGSAEFYKLYQAVMKFDEDRFNAIYNKFMGVDQL